MKTVADKEAWPICIFCAVRHHRTRVVGKARAATIPALTRGLGNGKTHLAAGEVGDATHGVDGLVGGPCTDKHMVTRQHLGLKKRHHLGQQFVGFEHAAIAHLAAGLIALAHGQHVNAIGLQLRHVALGGGVGPHFAVHGGTHDEGHGAQRAGWHIRLSRSSTPQVQQLACEIGAGRGPDGICLAAGLMRAMLFPTPAASRGSHCG